MRTERAALQKRCPILPPCAVLVIISVALSLFTARFFPPAREIVTVVDHRNTHEGSIDDKIGVGNWGARATRDREARNRRDAPARRSHFPPAGRVKPDGPTDDVSCHVCAAFGPEKTALL